MRRLCSRPVARGNCIGKVASARAIWQSRRGFNKRGGMGRVWAALLVLATSAGALDAQPLASWVQQVDGGASEVRAVVADSVCPDAEVDGRPLTMKVRAGPDAAAFPQTVCSLTLPKHVERLSVSGHSLTPPRRRVDKILVMGDTGCRVKGMTVQACNDPRAWPFALIMKRAAAEQPDLVIHVGDYYYRESACPPLYAGCVGTPHGDLWPSWAADFFDPAQPLLDAAPWIFARGNHESCSRGWKGWSRMLEAGPAWASCGPESPVFNVPIGGVTLRVFDSADADDRRPTSETVALVRRQLDTLPQHAKASTDWIITHRPIWGETPILNFGPAGIFNVGLNRTEQAAVKGRDLSAVALIVSGHIHHFASFDFGGARPAQLVVGTGGDVGESADQATPYGHEVYIDEMEAKTLAFEQYGYFLMVRGKGEVWNGVFKDLDGRAVARCSLVSRQLSCAVVK